MELLVSFSFFPPLRKSPTLFAEKVRKFCVVSSVFVGSRTMEILRQSEIGKNLDAHFNNNIRRILRDFAPEFA